MWLPILGLILGLLLGTIFTFEVPIIFAKYLSIGVLAALDSLLGALRSMFEKKYESPILVTGFFTNILLAAGLAYLGDLLGLDLYLAAVIAFGLRIFSNLSFTRRYLINLYRNRSPKVHTKQEVNLLPINEEENFEAIETMLSSSLNEFSQWSSPSNDQTNNQEEPK